MTQIAKATIDKTSRLTDWSRRPLSTAQLDYAVADVIHLRTVYEHLQAQLDQSGRADWVAEELAGLTDPRTYQQPPELAWRRLKVRSRDPRYLAIVQALAAWRERSAQERDLPRNRVMRDDLLLEVAANRPTTVERLAKLKRISLDRRSAAAVVAAIGAALELPDDELPQTAAVWPSYPAASARSWILLRVLLKLKCEEHHVAQRLVATTGDLEAIAAYDTPDVQALSGWRFEIFGRDALALKRGKLGLAIAKGRLNVIPMTEALEPA